jgi:NAD+ kinase
VASSGRPDLIAFNDIVVVRDGDGQMRVTASVDGAPYARIAGDGCIVSTALGSSAYTLASGGPLVHPRLDAIVFTKLSTHGGFCPPLVIPPDSTLDLQVRAGHGGGRFEIDGRVGKGLPEEMSVTLVEAAATVVAFADDESHLTGLRRRGIIMDSPRILADDRRRG